MKNLRKKDKEIEEYIGDFKKGIQEYIKEITIELENGNLTYVQFDDPMTFLTDAPKEVIKKAISFNYDFYEDMEKYMIEQNYWIVWQDTLEKWFRKNVFDYFIAEF